MGGEGGREDEGDKESGGKAKPQLSHPYNGTDDTYLANQSSRPFLLPANITFLLPKTVV